MSKINRGGGSWKRPVSRMYSYNFQVGENYYHPMTTYLDAKYTDISAKIDTPGALSFRYIFDPFYKLVKHFILLYSERLAQNWITCRTNYGTRAAINTSNSSSSFQQHSFTTTTASY